MHAEPCAIFDLDHTVIRQDSVLALTRLLYQRGYVTQMDMLRAISAATRYRLGILDIEAVAQQVIEDMLGGHSEPFEQAARDIFLGPLRGWIRPSAIAAMAAERNRKRRIVLMTGGMQFIPDLISKHLDVDTVICTRMQIQNGRFVAGPKDGPVVGRGKAKALETILQLTPDALRESSAYGDSIADRFILSSIGSPFIVNPDRKLKVLALQNNWPVLRWP